MSREDILFWVAVIGAPAAIMSCLYQIISYHWPRGGTNMPLSPKPTNTAPIWINALLALIVCIAAGADFYGHRYGAPIELHMSGWGVDANPANGMPVYTATVETQPVSDKRDSYKLMLLTRNNWATVDRLTDTAIEKSPLYSIDGSVVTMQFPGKGMIRWAIGVPNAAELYVVMLRNDVGPDQITRLADVTKVGGLIVARAGQRVEGSPAAPIGANPPAQSPPNTVEKKQQ